MDFLVAALGWEPGAAFSLFPATKNPESCQTNNNPLTRSCPITDFLCSRICATAIRCLPPIRRSSQTAPTVPAEAVQRRDSCGEAPMAEAEAAASDELYRRLHFSPYNTLVHILWDEFASEVPEEAGPCGRTPASCSARIPRRAGEVRPCGRFRRDTGILPALHRACRNRSNSAGRWLTIKRRIFAKISRR